MPSTQIVKPDLPQTVIRWIGTAATRILPTTNQIVAIPIVHDWGPMLGDTDGMQLFTTLTDWENVYGNGDTPGRDAVVNAFVGMNVSDGGGAGGVYSPRMATGAAAAAAVTRQHTGAVNAITLTAKYKGVRGNNLTIAIEADPVTAANDRLRIMYLGVTVETYSYLRTDVAALVALVNGRPSRWVTAVMLVTGTALGTTASTALTGGNDGAVLTATEWAAATSALAYKEFGYFAPFNLTDSTIKQQLMTWVQVQANAMRPLRMVTGGAAAEVLSAVQTELALASGALRDEHHVRFGVGTYHDDVLNKDFSTAQLAPRIAGVLAARGRKSSLTSALLGGLHVVGSTGPSDSDLLVGRDLGVTLLKRISHPEAELAVSQGVTTFISKTTAGKPYEFFSEPRIVGLLDEILRRITTWGDDVVIGDLMVTDDTRREVGKEVTKILDEYEAEGTARPGTGFVNVINTDADPALADTIPFQFGFQPARTANYLIGEGRIS